MNRYNPDKTPDPKDWLLLDEQERIALVQRYHKRAKIQLPNSAVHAVIHTVVENQLAEGIPDVVEAFGRLRAEGLDRHDTIHAVGSVLAEHMHRLLTKSENASADPNPAYYAALRELTAARWRAG